MQIGRVIDKTFLNGSYPDRKNCKHTNASKLCNKCNLYDVVVSFPIFESCMTEYFMGSIDKDIFSPLELV